MMRNINHRLRLTKEDIEQYPGVMSVMFVEYMTPQIEQMVASVRGSQFEYVWLTKYLLVCIDNRFFDQSFLRGKK
jgi:hypothetical protein